MFNKNKPFENSPSGGSLSIPPASEPVSEPPAYAPRAAEAPRPSSTARSSTLSTLSAGVKYEGNISGAGELQVDGSLKGDIRVVHVVIGEGGSVEGSVHADVLEVRGRVAGSIVAKQVRLFASARIEGDITQEQLSIEQGAWFQGRCTQAKRDTPGANMLNPSEKPAPAPVPTAKTEKVEPKPAV